jgi:hypothetical protein
MTVTVAWYQRHVTTPRRGDRVVGAPTAPAPTEVAIRLVEHCWTSPIANAPGHARR